MINTYKFTPKAANLFWITEIASWLISERCNGKFLLQRKKWTSTSSQKRPNILNFFNYFRNIKILSSVFRCLREILSKFVSWCNMHQYNLQLSSYWAENKDIKSCCISIKIGKKNRMFLFLPCIQMSRTFLAKSSFTNGNKYWKKILETCHFATSYAAFMQKARENAIHGDWGWKGRVWGVFSLLMANINLVIKLRFYSWPFFKWRDNFSASPFFYPLRHNVCTCRPAFNFDREEWEGWNLWGFTIDL